MAEASLDHSTSTCEGGQGEGGSSEEGAGGATTSSVGQLGGGVEARKEEGSTATTSTFDRLPDELVSLVLFFAEDVCTLSAVCLDKRLYRLAVPIWASSLAPSQDGQPLLLQVLILRPDLQPLVRDFSGYFAEPLTFGFEFTAIRLLSNLRNLTLSFVAGEILPRAATDALRSLPNLERLEFDLEVPILLEDESFSIGQHLPRLRHLKVTTYSSPTFLPQLFQHPCPNLEHLSVYDGTELLFSRIPWGSLRSVDIGLLRDSPTALEVVKEGLNSALLEANGTLPLLRKVWLDDYGFGAHRGVLNVVELFEPIGAAGVSHLSLRLTHGAIIVPTGIKPLPAVERLRLRGSNTSIHEPDNLRALSTLLSAFPSLRNLHLVNIDFSDAPFYSLPNSAKDPSTRDFVTRSPALFDLLAHLRRSNVVYFELEQYLRRYKWTRSSREEDFSVELYTTFGV
ncbi:hypothetical protein JCM6882_007715 [Rhodosporidiobolus microsporus]